MQANELEDMIDMLPPLSNHEDWPLDDSELGINIELPEVAD